MSPAGFPNRRSIRLRDYDYAAAGPYFVTLCAYRGRCLFGRFVKGRIAAGPIGRIVQHCWEHIPAHSPHVNIDAYIVMPNHMHGIVLIHEADSMPCPYPGWRAAGVVSAADS